MDEWTSVLCGAVRSHIAMPIDDWKPPPGVAHLVQSHTGADDHEWKRKFVKRLLTQIFWATVVK